MVREYIVKVTDEVNPDAFQRFENYWSPEQEIVRCKDCRYGEPTKNGAGDDCIQCNNDDLWLDGSLNFPDWFCADGEKDGKSD